MKKFKPLLMTLTFAFATALAFGQPNTVTGNVANARGVMMDVIVCAGYDSVWIEYDTVYTDSSGFYTAQFTGNRVNSANWGMATILDCNRKTVTKTGKSTGAQRPIEINLDYCSNNGGGNNNNDVQGLVSNNQGKTIQVIVSAGHDSDWMQTDTVLTDVRGLYKASFRTTALQNNANWASAELIDCNRKTVSNSATRTSGTNPFSINLDYCKSNGGGKNCKAVFAVRQAKNGRTPVPYEVIVYENSRNATFYFWDFGDGTTSVQRTPTHSYKGNGPYYLCLTILDSSRNCGDTLCDSVSIDAYGMVHKKEGFTITTIQGDAPSSIENVTGLDANVYPNPVNSNATLNVYLGEAMNGNVTLTDLSGRVVFQSRTALHAGDNTINLPMESLDKGMYMIQLEAGNGVWNQSIVKN